MKRNGLKITNIAFGGVAILTLLAGMGFSFLVAKSEDAPGMVIFGSTAALAAAAFIYGLGQVIVLLRKNHEILSGISRKLADKE